jgi:hypothetical protein
MNFAERQEALVAKALGSLAYESIFIMPTSSEHWTRISVQDADLTLEEVSKLLGKKFTVRNDYVDPRTFWACDNKIAKEMTR